MQLILYRLLAAAVLMLVLALWIYPASEPEQQHYILLTCLSIVLILLLQAVLAFRQVAGALQRALQYGSDIILTSMLIFATGGILSPFSLLYGLVIIASGMHARRMLPMVMSILACSGYLAAIYGAAWFTHMDGLDAAQSLYALLQVSVLLLVGGVMAYIARRHASLHESSATAVRQHRKLKDLHDHIMNEMREGVIVLDKQRAVSDMNAAAAEMLGQLPVASVLAYAPLAEFFQQLSQPLLQCEFEYAEQVWLVTVQALSEDDDAAWLMTLVDISQMRQMERQLLQQEKMAVLGKMAAMLAHEIRNPIQTIDQGLEIMVRNPDCGASLQHVLHDEMMRLNRLVGTMLDYSRPLVPAPASTGMAAVLQASLQHVARDQAREVQLHCQLQQLRLDADHFRLVLDNLLSNALLNRQPAHSPVSVSLLGLATGWCLEVCNAGEIPAALQATLFEPFVSGRSSGIGLGLATVKQVCVVNGWHIEAYCESGHSCFRVLGHDVEEGA